MEDYSCVERQSVATGAALSLLLVLSGLSAALAAVMALRASSAVQAAPPQTDSLSPRRGSEGLALPEELEPGLHLVESDEHGIVLELFTPEFQVEQRTSDGGLCHLITAAGYGEADAAGWPRLPVKGAMVGIPPRAALALTVLEADATVVRERYDLCPVPRPIVEMDVSGEIRYRGVESVRDPEAYAADRFYPASLAEIVSTGFVRSQRVAQLRFHPFQYNPVSGELRHYWRIRVRLDFGLEGSQLWLAATGVEEDPFEDILRHTLVNYEAARRWRAKPEPLAPQAVFPSQSGPDYKILVDEDGIYQVTYAELQAAGVDVDSVDPRTFRLHNQGGEVAIYVAGEGDGSFDPGDYFLFYGQRMNTKYTEVNVYWLTYGAGDGERMAERDGTLSETATLTDSFQTTFHWEEDVNYQASVPSGEGGDHWFAGFVFASDSPASETYTLTLHNIATTPYSLTMRGLLYGWSRFGPSPDHHTRVYLNGHLVDDVTWDGWRDYQFEHNIPQSYLIEGTNLISVECPFDLPPEVIYDIVFVNWFEIVYRDTYVAEDDRLFFDGDEAGTWEYHVGGFYTDTVEAFDVTTPTSPTRILSATVEPGSTYTLTFEHTITAEHHYLALTPARRSSPLSIEEDNPSDLRSTANGADYIIVTHADFYTDVLPLAAHRAAQGLRTMVVDVQDVYDEFSYGVFDPTAIHDFLAYTYADANWVSPAPAYVLLVGDGNYDFKDNFGRGEPNYVPPYLADVDPDIGEAAADNRYVCISGDDILPDMDIGRLPVKTGAEASAVVAKVLAYEQNPPGGDWHQQVLFVADDYDPDAGDFTAYSDAIADHYLLPPYTAQKVYYKVTHDTPAEAKAAIINAINEGRLLVNYIGHASINFWAWEHLFDVDDLDLLTNSQALPLMVPMTCLEGYFIHPSPPGLDYSSLGESIVRAPGKGAVASWSPTGLGVASGHDYLNKGLFEAIFFDDVVQLGPATTQAKLYLYSNTAEYRELIDTYVLFGDPALRLNVLHRACLPLILRNFPKQRP